MLFLPRVSPAIIALVAAAPAFAAPPADKPRGDLVDVIHENDPAMVKATAAARATLPAFLEKAGDPRPGMRGFAVKIGIGPADNQEFVWISPFTVEGDMVRGQLANEPERVKGYFSGETIKAALSQVVDWTYLEGNTMKGNYSTCALMPRKSEAEKAELRQRFNLDCAAP